jgi:hypothetical protein
MKTIDLFTRFKFLPRRFHGVLPLSIRFDISRKLLAGTKGIRDKVLV